MTIAHAPRGNEHPYEQEPWERDPRDPLAGQTVRIGASVSLPLPATEVTDACRTWATWRTQNGASGRVDGRVESESRGAGVYRFMLPAFSEGDEVSYELHAHAGGERCAAGPFTFFVPWSMHAARLLTSAGSEHSLTVHALTSRPDLLLHLEIRLDAPDSVVIQPRLVPASPEPASALAHAPGDAPLVHRMGCFNVRISPEPLLVSIEGEDGSGILREVEPIRFLAGRDGLPTLVRQTFASPAHEGFYGFGERFNALDQRGNRLDNRVFDQYTRQGTRTYLPVPFFLSSRGYGHLVDTSGQVAYDMAGSNTDRWCYEASVDGTVPGTRLFVGRPRDVVRRLGAASGSVEVPPSWAFGPWMSSNEWNSQRVVMEAADRSRDLGIPATVLVIEAWSDEATFSIWNEALYEPRDPALPFHLVDFSFPEHGLWPDPRRMIAELHARGLKVVLWQIPVLKKISGNPQHDRDLEFVRKRGWYVRNPDGSPYAVRPPWFREAMVLDFTNPDARRWWFNRRRYLVREIGVDGFKTDGGEHLWGSGLRFFDGSTSEQMANLFSNTYIGAYRAFLEDQEGAEALTFSRAGYMGAQRFPMHWAGDQDSTWESHRAVLRAVMNANLSGIPFVGWDIGGFAGPVPSPELYLRSAAMSLFSPLMQYHSDFNGHRTPIIDRTPWNIAETSGDESVIAIYRRLARARMALVPYIFQEAQWCAREHEPLMRPLFLDWPDSAEAWRCQDQYLFGRGLLVAPVLSAGVTARAVYLPEGEWECLHTGARLVGERTVTWAAPVERIPAFVRQGSAFPVDEVRAALLG